MHELHIHLGGAVPSAVLWEILCDNGLQTEYDDFDSFHQSLTVNPEEVRNLDDFLGRYFNVTELIQSSPSAASVSAYQLVAKAYRRSGVEAVELRFNPVKRVRHGIHTLEGIILAVTQGLERASMHYGVKTGIILSMGRELSLETNWQITQTAIEWYGRGALHGAHGLVGLDMAGPESGRKEFLSTWMNEMAAMYQQAREAGLGTTYHIGETSSTGFEGVRKVVENLQPDRIGHGIEIRKAKGKDRDYLFSLLKERKICLEICPSINMVTRSISDFKELADLMVDLTNHEIPFCLGTDNPYLIHTNLRREYDIMREALGDRAELLEQCSHHCSVHTFLKDG